MHFISDTFCLAMLTRISRAVYLTILASLSAYSWGQNPPQENKSAASNPIKLIVPFTPGTGIDIIARSVSQPLSQALGQPVIVENRVGASGNIGTELVVRSKPDGNTLLVTVSTLVMNRALYSNLTFDAVIDLIPITLAAKGELVLAVPEKSLQTTLKDFIQSAQKNPGKMSYGSPGIGTPHHLSMELFKNETQTKLLHVPYRGTAPAFTDLLGNQIDAMFIPIHVAQEHIKSGKLRGLALGATKRNVRTPEIPTFKELGFEQMNVEMWYGFMAPNGLSNNDLNRLGNALRKILVDPSLKTGFESQGLDPVISSSEEFKNIIAMDASRWAKLIQLQGIKPE